MAVNLEKKLIDYIRQKGPVTGSELREAFNEDSLILWQTCACSKTLLTKRTGTRYMRLDRRVEGFARLSPSILREFLTYSVTGLSDNPDGISKIAFQIASHVERVSSNKLGLARSIVANIRERTGNARVDSFQICFFIAGDIVYNMSHDVPRPEQSTGKLVNGSDIDLVIVLEDNASDDFINNLDKAIYQEKYRTLITPSLKEEVDYVIKRVGKVREQIRFDTFKNMVACKILQEGLFLHGSKDLFLTVKTMLKEQGVTEKLKELEKRAHIFRKNAEEYLLHADPDKAKKESLYLFYPVEESEEFE